MEMNFDPFVLPFFLGMLFLLIVVFWRFVIWFDQIGLSERKIMFHNVFSIKFFKAIIECFRECLLHRKIFKINPFLGYMHMSLAFGWFLLIVVGAVESKFGHKEVFNMPWDAIFFNFFEKDMPRNEFLAFVMDFLLLIILIAVGFAIFKRFSSRIFGMKKTTNLRPIDKIGLYSLWSIFPLRLLAESLNAANYNNGSFLTDSFGNGLSAIVSTQVLEYPMWWAYSISLGLFFVALPYTRYMHILAEVGLVFLRNLGVKPANDIVGYTNFEIQSCSRCGICIDKCQLSSSANINDVQPAYFIRSVRHKTNFENKYLNCLMCGRCNTYCPVGIDITNIRTITRKKTNARITFDFNYIDNICNNDKSEIQVLYYAGCMSHLTPSIPKAMIKLLTAAGVSFKWIDEDKSICCGRPLVQAGMTFAAEQLRKKNSELIYSYNSKILVCSCPICYKTFKDDYKLNMHVLHHTDLLKILIDNGKLKPSFTNQKFAYHDPCELGRSCNIYDTPREVLNHCGNLVSVELEREKALCCGGSLANIDLTQEKRQLIAADVVKSLTENNPDIIVTACPLCKKTLSPHADNKVLDIAEVLAETNLQ